MLVTVWGSVTSMVPRKVCSPPMVVSLVQLLRSMEALAATPKARLPMLSSWLPSAAVMLMPFSVSFAMALNA